MASVEIENKELDSVSNKKAKYNDRESWRSYEVNENFVNFYKEIFTSEELEKILKSFEDLLPSTFRINLNSRKQTQMKFLLATLFSDQLQDHYQPIEWLPDEISWQTCHTKKSLKKDDCVEELHNFLVMESELSHITRQELVSMIPVHILNPEPHHKVLDMCAAPGSKTTQILEHMYSKLSDGQSPTGFLIANDVSRERCKVLSMHGKRMLSDCLIVSNNDSTIFPSIIMKQANGAKENVLFDRILCDVPCSGDGTIRKNRSVMHKWKLQISIGLLRTQHLIASRGITLLKPEGLMIYSTCSLNPLENEAVVCSLLRKFHGSIELADAREYLPLLKTQEVITNWEKFHSTLPKKLSLDHANLASPTAEELTEFHLNFCLRIHPHANDTGGFFVALFKKLPSPSSVNTQEIASLNFSDKKEEEMIGRIVDSERLTIELSKSESIVFSSDQDSTYKLLGSFYGCNSISHQNLIFRGVSQSGLGRCMYLINDSTRNIIINNYEKLRIISCGVRALEKSKMGSSSSDCPYRMTHEILYYTSPMMKTSSPDELTRKVFVDISDFEKLLITIDLHISDLSDSVSQIIEKMKSGCLILKCVIKYPNPKDKSEVEDVICFAAHKGVKNVRLMVTNADRFHALLLLKYTTRQAMDILKKIKPNSDEN